MTEITLNTGQNKASVMFTKFLIDKEAKYMVITGSPGTGKTTLVKTLLRTIESRLRLYGILLGSQDDVPKLKIELTATTNKAAAVLTKLTGQQCTTVHSRLHLVPRDNYTTGKTDFIKGKDYELIYGTLLVIDEGSYLDQILFDLIDETTVDCKVLIIGDQYQLASPGETEPIMVKIKGYKAHLEQVMRHGGAIAQASARFKQTIKTGTFEPIVVNDTDIIHVDGPTFQRMVDAEFLRPDYCENKARILAWQNETVKMYNDHIRRILGHPAQFGLNDVLTTNRPIPGCKKMVAGTDASVEIVELKSESIEFGIPGRWVKLDEEPTSYFLPHDSIKAGAFIKQLRREKNWKVFFRLQKEWLDLRPAFASTVHKAQGSTYDTVFINLTDIGKCFIPSDVARMLNVAISRAAKRVVLYGQLPFYYQGVSNEQPVTVNA